MSDLGREERMQLFELLCAFAWADRRIHPEERRYIERLADQIGLDASERQRVEAWLERAPAPGSPDLADVPEAHRARFVQAIESLIAVDGEIAAAERDQLLRLVRRLSGRPGRDSRNAPRPR